jgi:hypothetical protein
MAVDEELTITVLVDAQTRVLVVMRGAAGDKSVSGPTRTRELSGKPFRWA